MRKFFLAGLFLISTAYAQNIKAYFNQSVDNSVSTITDAIRLTNIDDTIVALINKAQTTLDIAVWDNGSAKIVTAINAAYTRGVQVRYISSSNSTNTALSGLNSNIPVLLRNSSLTSNVMHNKFVIVDNTRLLMGSMNFGDGSMFDDFNNIVIINDATLAQNYTIEFNEMWGSTGAQPNTSNSKFGPDKTDNTVHSFTIGGKLVEQYFSPTDNTTANIVNAINSADFTLDIAMFTFINNDLGDAVIAAKNRGVTVRCIIENVSYFGSEYNSLVSAGISVLSHENIAYDFHHKYCIVDAQHASSDPLVVTGSHNWTNSAEDEYDENTLIIHDETIANQYLEEFSKRFQDLSSVAETTINDNALQCYPNPSTGNFTIENIANEQAEVSVYDVYGKCVKIFTIQPNALLKIENFAKGIYFLQLNSGVNLYSKKIVVC